MEDARWRPGGCPISEEQTHGYKHIHSENCGASPEQIMDQQQRLAQASWKGRYLKYIRGFTARRQVIAEVDEELPS